MQSEEAENMTNLDGDLTVETATSPGSVFDVEPDFKLYEQPRRRSQHRAVDSRLPTESTFDWFRLSLGSLTDVLADMRRVGGDLHGRRQEDLQRFLNERVPESNKKSESAHLRRWTRLQRIIALSGIEMNSVEFVDITGQRIFGPPWNASVRAAHIDMEREGYEFSSEVFVIHGPPQFSSVYSYHAVAYGWAKPDGHGGWAVHTPQAIHWIVGGEVVATARGCKVRIDSGLLIFGGRALYAVNVKMDPPTPAWDSHCLGANLPKGETVGEAFDASGLVLTGKSLRTIRPFLPVYNDAVGAVWSSYGYAMKGEF